MLKRHLKTAYDMSPEDYSERWGLPADYPMVAPNYARQRSKLAKQIGLGIRARRKGEARLPQQEGPDRRGEARQRSSAGGTCTRHVTFTASERCGGSAVRGRPSA